MVYLLLADLVLIFHGAFVLFVVLGGGLLMRRPRWAWIHGPSFLWAGFIELTGGICPLTPLEYWLRSLCGAETYQGDFIERILTALLYPDLLTREMQIILGLLVLVLNAGLYLCLWSCSRPENKRGRDKKKG
jgi:hypothetical protein